MPLVSPAPPRWLAVGLLATLSLVALVKGLQGAPAAGQMERGGFHRMPGEAPGCLDGPAAPSDGTQPPAGSPGREHVALKRR